MKNPKKTYQSRLSFEISLSEKALRLLGEKRADEALNTIDEALEDENTHINWNVKGLIYDFKKEYKKAVECFDNAIKIKETPEILINKANALYKWAKITYFPEGNLDNAMNLIDDAIATLPDGEDSSEMWFLKGEIYQSLENPVDARKCFLKAEKRLDELEILESELAQFEKYRNDTLINIVGFDFYRGLEVFSPGKTFRLVKDDKNEHDPDAVAVVDEGETVGYAANSDYTRIFDVSGASDIKNRIGEASTAEVILIFQNEFVIAKVNF